MPSLRINGFAACYTNLSLCFRLIIQINAFSQSKGNNVSFDIWNGSGESINFTPSPQYNYPFLSICFAPLFTILFTHTPLSKPCLIRINTARFNNCPDKIRDWDSRQDETRQDDNYDDDDVEELLNIRSTKFFIRDKKYLVVLFWQYRPFIFQGENKIGGRIGIAIVIYGYFFWTLFFFDRI